MNFSAEELRRIATELEPKVIIVKPDRYLGSERALGLAESFEQIVAVYQCAQDEFLKAEAIKKLDSRISRWFKDATEEDIEYLSLKAPNGSQTHSRAFKLFLDEYLE